jgi:hypothetical protein
MIAKRFRSFRLIFNISIKADVAPTTPAKGDISIESRQQYGKGLTEQSGLFNLLLDHSWGISLGQKLHNWLETEFWVPVQPLNKKAA